MVSCTSTTECILSVGAPSIPFAWITGYRDGALRKTNPSEPRLTPQRFHRLCAVLDHRQPDLSVLFDNVHKPRNFSALLRTCDAVGVHEAHAVWPDPRLRLHHLTSGGAGKWVRVTTHPSSDCAIAHVKAAGMKVFAADPSEGAHDYHDVDYTEPCAIVLGAELQGLSDSALAQADARIVVPLVGMVHSLNVSVAGALILFEAQRQRTRAGLYDRSRLDPELRRTTLFEWAHPEVARYCQRRQLAYPELDADGEIASRSWRDKS